LQLQEYDRFLPEVAAINVAFDRGFSDERLRQRFERGLTFFALREQSGQVVATAWVVPPGGERFIDEAGAGLRLGTDAASLRDVFVAPGERRRGLFSTLVGAVTARVGGLKALWSVVDRSNAASLHAHGRSGFEIMGRLEVLHLAGLVMLRLRWPGHLLEGSTYAEGRRILLTGDAYRTFRAERLA
jgi:GNAT superfamily N-acetyltransferase